ncbi:bacterioferritin-associated ferredoxin, partial [Ottowia sp.]|uniref:(2Fe-2S)-binding protein n=1 Tax=Ottowia sp. TaxID=1898956 RepID=UPI0039E351FC
LAPGAAPPRPVAARTPQVCTCFDVGEAAIVDCLSRCPGDDSERLAKLQAALKCGTNCGSCIPELRRLVRATQAGGVTA